jgi:uncharacterized Zn finger protein
MAFSCDCPLVLDGEFRKHCVAVGLAWMEGNAGRHRHGAGDGRSYFARRVDHSALLEILLWEGEVEAAWREAKEGGCSEGLWIALADRRARDHPEDSLTIYKARIEPLVEQTNNAAYEQAYELLLKTRILMRRLGREQEFEEYVELLREEFKRKRNFMKLLGGME